LKKRKTTKLFYNKYLYKISVTGDYVDLFSSWNNSRPYDYSFVGKTIDQISERQKNKQPLTITSKSYWRIRERSITPQSFKALKKLYGILTNSTDYFRTRHEYRTLNIYTNDTEILNQIKNDKYIFCAEYWEPDENSVNALLNQKQIIIVNEPPEYEFKVTIKNYKNNEKFGNWVESNRSKVKITDYSLGGLKESHYWQDTVTFYVRDQKILSLAQMFIGQNIKRIERLVYIGKD